MAEPLESTTAATTFADDFLDDFVPVLSPAEEEGEEEEELEWMKSFPPLETFLSAPAVASSPVSVLPLAPPMNLPARARSKICRRKRRVFYSVSVPAEISGPVQREKGKRKCLHCGSETTPQWRAGPMGPKTLCNACGVRYKSGRLLPEYRPANSPSFSAAVHSNSHRKVMEMRRRGAIL